MAAKAFILASVEPASTQAVGNRLRSIPGSVVYEITGPFDFIIDVEADTPEDLTSILRTKIRPVPGITNTLTCMVLPSPGNG